MRALSPATRQGVIELMNSHGGQIRGQMAHQAARGDLDASEREAFRTLAAASAEIRTQGIHDFSDIAGAQPVAAPSTSTSATDRGPGSTDRRVDVADSGPRSGLAGHDGASSIPPARGGNGSSSDGGAR